MGCVDAEDVEHMKSRVRMFSLKAKLRCLKDTSVCPHCMCKWIVEGAAAFDRRPALQVAPPSAAGVQPGQHHPPSRNEEQGYNIIGFSELVRCSSLPAAVADSLSQDLRQMGAVHVCELTLEDWQGCLAIQSARPLEQRRFFNVVPVLPQA